MLNKRERLAIFYERLESASVVSTAEAALELVNLALVSVEDEFSGEPNEPDRWQELDRMFPPQADSISTVSDGIKICRSRRHRTYLAQNGAIEIRSLVLDPQGQPEVYFKKAVADGRFVCDVCPRLKNANR